jgi:hypothetical protein
MRLFTWVVLCGIGIWLAPRVRQDEPWFLRWGWLLSLSLIGFGISSGTSANFQQWLVGTTQAWLAAVFCCELRLRIIRKRATGTHPQKR